MVAVTTVAGITRRAFYSRFRKRVTTRPASRLNPWLGLWAKSSFSRLRATSSVVGVEPPHPPSFFGHLSRK